jgi:sialate O-acetylesterase
MELRSIRKFATLITVVGAIVVELAANAAPLRADVQLDRLFSANAVLQRGVKVPIFGTADPGEEVTIGIQNLQEKTTADADGKWQVQVGPLKVGGPFLLTATGGTSGVRRLSINNVMVGDVWVCAGGGNMTYSLLNSEGGGTSVINSLNHQMRLYMVKREGAKEPRTQSDIPWVTAGAASVGSFSGVGYFFGRTLVKYLAEKERENVPIGLIGLNHDISSIESWISREALESSPTLKSALDKPISSTDSKSPTVLFNGMVNPVTRYAVRGVLWYHGESSVESAYQYREALPLLIADWRKHWNRPDLPFLIVQLTAHKVISKVQIESKLAELRESQFLAAKQTPHTALVVTVDHGDPISLHPREKEPIGQRAALAAQGLVYGDKIEYTGPLLNSAGFAKGRAELRFLHVGTGLMFKGTEKDGKDKDGKEPEAKGFFVCGADHVFHEGKATLEGDTLVVTSPNVPAPEAVRYGWSDFPTGNLYNKEGLPASPFRTDNYPLLTTPQAE